MGISRVCVKASPAFGRRRLHTNTDNIDLASAAARLTPLALEHRRAKKKKKLNEKSVPKSTVFPGEEGSDLKVAKTNCAVNTPFTKRSSYSICRACDSKTRRCPRPMAVLQEAIEHRQWSSLLVATCRRTDQLHLAIVADGVTQHDPRKESTQGRVVAINRIIHPVCFSRNFQIHANFVLRRDVVKSKIDDFFLREKTLLKHTQPTQIWRPSPPHALKGYRPPSQGLAVAPTETLPTTWPSNMPTRHSTV